MTDTELKEKDLVDLPEGERGTVIVIQPPLCKVRVWCCGAFHHKAYKIEDVKKVS